MNKEKVNLIQMNKKKSLIFYSIYSICTNYSYNVKDANNLTLTQLLSVLFLVNESNLKLYYL